MLCRPAALLALHLSLLLALACPAWPATVATGAQLLHESGYSSLKGVRVGVITNHTALVGDRHLVDMLAAQKEITVSAIFAPEHGFRGMQEDGVKISDGRDERTGLPVISLYGATRKPTPAMLATVDLLLFDIQDIGARFYTYISTMGLAMQAAAAKGIPFVVLDRPNPLGGNYVGGPVLEKELSTFTGAYTIPIAHGLTIGELALMIKGERLLAGLENLDLRVIPMRGWQRSMLWPDTGLPWLRTSPNIPDFTTALLYPGMCLFEGTSASVGRGTLEPFKLVGIPGSSGTELATTLSARQLPGVSFTPAAFTPQSIPGMSSSPPYKGKQLAGLRVTLTVPHAFRSVESGLHLVSAMYHSRSSAERRSFFSTSGFDHLAGSRSVRQALEAGSSADEIIASWRPAQQRFMAQRATYLLY